MAFSISPDRQHAILSQGLDTGTLIMWMSIPAVFLCETWNGRAAIMLIHPSGKFEAVIVKIRDIKKRTPQQ